MFAMLGIAGDHELNVPTWTLIVEIQVSLFIPLLVGALKRFKVIIIIATFSAPGGQPKTPTRGHLKNTRL